MARYINKEGLSLIKEFQPLHLSAISNDIGEPIIGYGHTNNVKLGDVITQEKADALLKQDLNIFEELVDLELSNIYLNNNQFSALVSLTSCVGIGCLTKGSLLRSALDKLNYSLAADRILLYNYREGEIIQKLVRRRSKERALFLSHSLSIEAQDIYLLVTHNSFLKRKPLSIALLDSHEITRLNTNTFLYANLLGQDGNHHIIKLDNGTWYIEKHNVIILDR